MTPAHQTMTERITTEPERTTIVRKYGRTLEITAYTATWKSWCIDCHREFPEHVDVFDALRDRYNHLVETGTFQP